jgi:hypothetical protein
MSLPNFGDSPSYGGRWYGPYWESLPEYVRAELLINGQPVFGANPPSLSLRLTRATRSITGQVTALAITTATRAVIGSPIACGQPQA